LPPPFPKRGRDVSVPCVGCGWCCLDNQCETSHRLYGYRKRCPSLRFDETRGRYLCMLMLDPVHAKESRRANFESQGCCNPLGEWRKDVRNRDDD
jgi:hypothetical protein